MWCLLCACVFSYRLCLYICVETVDNACAIADTLLNGVRARLCGHSVAVSVRFEKRVVDMTRPGDDTMCIHSM